MRVKLTPLVGTLTDIRHYWSACSEVSTKLCKAFKRAAGTAERGREACCPVCVLSSSHVTFFFFFPELFRK